MHTLAISDNTEFTVKFTLKDGRVQKPFSVTFNAVRLPQDEITARVAEKENKIKDFLPEVITGWSAQRLVLDEQGQPCAFSPEALDMMLNIMGVALICFNAYFKDCGAKEKN